MPDPRYPHLSKAPIAEAAIEIRSAFEGPVPDAQYDAFASEVKDRYPSALAVQLVSANLTFVPAGEPQQDTSTSRVGVRVESADKATVAVAKNDGLVVSRLTPYQSWDELSAEIRSLWATYVRIFQPREVTRLGMRFINRIQIDYVDGVADFGTVFTAGPQIPPDLPQTLETFASRVVMPMPSHYAMLAIVQALEAQTVDGHFAVLDIDAFTETLMNPNTEDMWHHLSRLRELKNMAFFSSLHRPIWERYL